MVVYQLGNGFSITQVSKGEGSAEEDLFFLEVTRHFDWMKTEVNPTGKLTRRLPPFSRETMIRFINSLAPIKEKLLNGEDL
jgi:hypothetical protein